MKRWFFIVAALSGLCWQASAQTTSDAIQSAHLFKEMSIADAGAAGRWVIWTDGTAPDTTVTLALVSPDKQAVWSEKWASAYTPTLRPLPEWQHANSAMLAVTMQFGAMAEEVSLFGLTAGKPVKLTSVLAKAVSWMISREGDLLLVLYNTTKTAHLRPNCYKWDDSLEKLIPRTCSW